MDRGFEKELKELRELILEMGGYVENSIDQACNAIIDRKPGKFRLVTNYEDRINEAHKQVDRQCLQLLARQSLVAADLRFVLVVAKINSDLERMGDQAYNISFNGQSYLSYPPVHTRTDILNIAKMVRKMVRDSLDAFVHLDVDLSQRVLEGDDSVDNAKDQIFNELKEYMKSQPNQIDACMDLILIARNLERLADHATNIAEEVIFLVTGDDVRHGTETTTKQSIL